MAVTRVVCTLNGFVGAPGINVWHVADPTFGAVPVSADSITTAFDAFYTAIATLLQSDVNVTIPNTLLNYDIANGQPVSATPGTLGDQSASGTGTTSSAHFVAAKVQLRTGVYEDGRELRGGPFIGPWGRGMNPDGSLPVSSGTTLLNTSLQTLATALTTAGYPLVVYRQPREATDTLPARVGSAALVSSIAVNPLPAVQRRRRD